MSPVTTRLRVLLTEDNPVNERVVVAMLESEGHEVAVARNGIEAIERLDRESFDVVLLDVQMPKMDGLEAAREIRRRSTVDSCPVLIALTAHALPEDRAEGLRAGFDEYLTKPVSLDTLSDALARAARRDRNA